MSSPITDSNRFGTQWNRFRGWFTPRKIVRTLPPVEVHGSGYPHPISWERTQSRGLTQLLSATLGGTQPKRAQVSWAQPSHATRTHARDCNG